MMEIKEVKLDEKTQNQLEKFGIIFNGAIAVEKRPEINIGAQIDFFVMEKFYNSLGEQKLLESLKKVIYSKRLLMKYHHPKNQMSFVQYDGQFKALRLFSGSVSLEEIERDERKWIEELLPIIEEGKYASMAEEIRLKSLFSMQEAKGIIGLILLRTVRESNKSRERIEVDLKRRITEILKHNGYIGN